MSTRHTFIPAYAYSDQQRHDARRGLRFDPQAMHALSDFDRLLFERFGQGPEVAPPFRCIHHAIEHQARVQPQAIAARHAGQTLSYQELDRQANHLANHLRRLGVTFGDQVGLFTRRSLSMLVSMLACMKVGAAYVPLDATIAPPAQMRYIIQMARIDVVLTSAACYRNAPQNTAAEWVDVDGYLHEIDRRSGKLSSLPLRRDANKEDGSQCCFVLFTSGTTGKPNGVQVSHANLCNILLTAPGNLGMKPGLKVSQILNIAFDMSAWEILGCLGNGATLVIREDSIEAAVREADIVIATPSVLAGLDTDHVRPIRVAAVAGEPCPRALADHWAGFCAFYNSCGPTETTIINTAQRHHPESETLGIGMPTPNNTVYILDAEMNPCPIGEVGEMWAGGDCVTMGYLGNGALTEERYRPDPFLGHGRMMFRTRDLGRWTRHGQLEHLGRTDDQVKIRGFRVELDAVSAILESQPGCQRAVALKLNSRDLVAFIAPATLDTTDARQRVAEQLPYYCVPKQVFALPELPLTKRGKIDKRLLLRQAEALAADLPALTEEA